MRSHAEGIAQSHEVDERPAREKLLARLRENERVIRAAYHVVFFTTAKGRQVAPAAEWLLDNFYLIEEQIRIARELLPASYSKKLPSLRTGPLRGFPAVYAVALELVSHTDGRVDVENLSAFTQAYQRVRPLKLGELWAIPIMLRLALIENLRRVSSRIAWRRRNHDLAQEWAQRFIAVVNDRPKDLIRELADFAGADVELHTPFVAELSSNLRGQSATLALVLNWLDQQLAARGQNLEQILQAESQDQALDQVSIANSISSLRTLNSEDWRTFVENESVTEKALLKDPLRVHGATDFRTRDRCRHVVEELARRSRIPEPEVAAQAVQLARERAVRDDVDRRETHAGFFLIGEGRLELEARIGYSPPFRLRVERVFGHLALPLYLGGIGLLSLLFAAAFLPVLRPVYRDYHGWTLIALLPLLLVASRAALRLVNWVATHLVPPRPVPRMDFSSGIPDAHRTAVVVPTLLTSLQQVPKLLGDLELRYLSNRDANLRFVILTDFGDAAAETLPTDRGLLDAAETGLRELNERYSESDREIFHWLHRPRLWNPGERQWMGYERKRGKLSDFNRLILSGDSNRFSAIFGNPKQLEGIRYVITLDTDTQLPAQTGWKMVGTLAHPLNRPVLNAATRCVERGFGVLQPRVAISLTGAARSRFARLFAGEVGLDPYTREVSNLYHDVFGRGQFIGKGIYDVAAFEGSVGERFPENTILSHDLIEGCHARCGFINDVELIEEHPSRYLADVNRRLRWIRGDWQIAPWLGWFAPGPPSGAMDSAAVCAVRGRPPEAQTTDTHRRLVDSKTQRPACVSMAPGGRASRQGPRGRIGNPLGLLSRWQIFDNLRRSVVPAAFLALLTAAWLAPGVDPAECMVLLMAVWFLPHVFSAVYTGLRLPEHLSFGTHGVHVAQREGQQLLIEAIQLCCLPYEALGALGSVARVYWRAWISRRRRLEWKTAQDASRDSRVSCAAAFREMVVCPGVAIAVLAAVWFLHPAALPFAAPFLCIWFVAPMVAWLISRPLSSAQTRLTSERQAFLRCLARRTWAYFEQFAGPDQSWLPADNFQEYPESRLAERTSPTNIGLALLSTVAAHDFGYLSARRAVERVCNTLSAMESLRRYRGHFLNWHTTRDRQPLTPLYVSTVDSGNLAADLIVLRGALEELVDAPVLTDGWRNGLEDVAGVLIEELGRSSARGTSAGLPGARDAAERLGRCIEALAQVPDSLPESVAAIREFMAECDAFPASLHSDPEAAFWIATARRQCEELLTDTLHLMPWLEADPWQAISRVPTPDAPPGWDTLVRELARPRRLTELAGLSAGLLPRLDECKAAAAPSLRPLLYRLAELLEEAGNRAGRLVTVLEEQIQRTRELGEMDMDFLYDRTRKLLSIGFSLDSHRMDAGSYDLLASEARLCSFVAIAQNKLPQEHWFLLGRQAAPVSGPRTLLSWSGSMFEYLMPLLVMPTYEGTLLDQACRGAMLRQIQYGRRQRIPWGISESCYNQFDRSITYQYRAFGVPELGLKRGLADDLVIAPYASVMALMLAPVEACANLERMAAQGLVGRYGFYEAVDYTPIRLPSDQSSALIRCYMAHHSGMSLLALAHALRDRPMQRRFLRDPECRAASLLLQERIPLAARRVRPLAGPPSGTAEMRRSATPRKAVLRRYETADTPRPEVHLLSNGRYSVMINNAGGGFSRWHNMALTRWREDIVQDAWGTFFYLHDVDRGHTWSTTYLPMKQALDSYEVIFSQGRTEFRSRYRQIEVQTVMAVSPEDDIEIRRLNLVNRSSRKRTLELTSYAEVVLLDPEAELSHPAFQNLFVETESFGSLPVLLATRRARAVADTPPWMFHMLVLSGVSARENVSFETDRARFLGRRCQTSLPAAMDKSGPLSGTAGAVLDPVFAIRHRITLEPGQSLSIDAVTGAAADRPTALALADRYQSRRLADRVFDVAWTHSQVMLHHLRTNEVDAQLFAHMASGIVYADAHYRGPPSVLARNRRGQSDLWRYGISGDLPVVLVRITEPTGLDLARKMIQAHAYWRQKGLRTDMVFWADAHAGYRQSLLDDIIGLVNTGIEAQVLDQPGGIFVRSTDQLPEEDQTLFMAVARLVLSDQAGPLDEQLDRPFRTPPGPAPLQPSREPDEPLPGEELLPYRELTHFNGLGGFTPDGREYVIALKPGQETPAPWVNVLANEQFGCIVSESGAGYTWFENAHEYRLTTWHNDPLTDPTGEAFYVRDEETGRYWSPSAGPARGDNPYVCRHGLGYTVFEHTQDGLFTRMTVAVATDAPVKLTSFSVRNLSARDRRISVTGFCEWVLGERRDRCGPHVVSRLDPQTGALFAVNPYRTEFAGNVAFFQATGGPCSRTADRREFIGRNGSLQSPEALRRKRLSGSVGAGFDPCAALQVYLDIPAGQKREVVFTMGAAKGEDQARALLRRFSDAGGSRQALEQVWQFWKHLLGGIYVETPDAAVNHLVNNWLLYQIIACRFWGRSGLYQSGGAYGFRDQLQDSMAFLLPCPWLTRPHLLRCAARQFHAGDVQHWWHPPSGRGVRTRFSDDYLWLPLAVARYVLGTGDTGVLDETIPFVEGRELAPGEESVYALWATTEERASLYDHCVRALRRGLQFGPNGLPLMGCGDWNDGLNRVGLGGKGESVWLAFFLCEVLRQFERVARMRQDQAVIDLCSATVRDLKGAIDGKAWDGQWYRRAYFDDGQVLGSAESPECKIDLLPQSWSALSGVGQPERVAQALNAVLEHLVDPDLRLIRLLTPPFDKAAWDPGYIRGYLPGVRENGGQYTHAAVWTAMAFAVRGDAEQAWRLFDFINPILHGDTPERIARYKVEPYVAAADVYTLSGHEGRGGWTWYTGSASWMYRLLVENLLGLQREGDRLTLTPLLPPGWTGYRVHYRYCGTMYHIEFAVVGPDRSTVRRVRLDQVELADRVIRLADDHKDHVVRVELG